MRSFWFAFVVKQFFGVAVVGGDNHHAAKFVDFFSDSGELKVDGFHGGDGGLDFCEVADHVAPRKVKADEFVLIEIFQHGVGDFRGFHPRAGVKREGVGVDFDVVFPLGFVVAVAVEVISDVAKFDGLRDGKLVDAVLAEESVEWVVDFDGRDELVFRHMSVGVIFGHAGENDVFGVVVATVKVGKVDVGEGLGDFDGAVGAEVVIDEAVAFFDLADGLVVFVNNNEGGEILVLDFGVLFAESFDGFGGGAEVVFGGAAEHIPAFFNHGPIVFVTVAYCNHTAGATGDFVVTVSGFKAFEEGFKAVDVFWFALRRDVAAVKDKVHADSGNVLRVGHDNHFFQMYDCGVDVAVREDAGEVESGFVLLDIVNNFGPSGGVPDFAGGESVFDFGDALFNDLAGAKGVVANFAVAHVAF